MQIYQRCDAKQQTTNMNNADLLFISLIWRTDKHLDEVNSPSTHLQNFPGDSLTSISLTGSVSGPRMSTGRGEVHSTFWTRWYARLTQSDTKNTNQSTIFFSKDFNGCYLDVCSCLATHMKVVPHHQGRGWSLCWWRPEPPSLCCLWSCCACVSVSSWRRICGLLQRESYWSLPSFLSRCVCGKTLGPSYTTHTRIQIHTET